ncbi:MAG: NADH:flavin oxidoreductase/NADH oxidase family protein [Gammaproteobacteria bacterium AqS3]|nr:NADH:flavin oxidoreductase/NADH oxidase family protein [Gammaproteobacteria bacterium AqS3]
MSENTVDVTQPLELPCGVTIRNRIYKSALTEGLADLHNRATEQHANLYGLWSRGGFGIVTTGNVQVDRRYLERSGNVAIDDNGGLDELARFAEAGTAGGTHLWMQIGHAGRQVTRLTNPEPVGPSAVAMQHEALQRAFGTPRALSEEEILNVIHRFTQVAATAKSAGFTGVQLHSAHGYLLSSFLSPRFNRRDDRWGGTLENRARLLLETFRAVRRTVGPDFPVGIKLNSSDFQKDGYTDDDALQVIEWLNGEGVDLLELSGGNYESRAFAHRSESTRAREAYFLEFAERAAGTARMPVAVTGGFRSRPKMDAALRAGACQMIGLGRPAITEPDSGLKLCADPETALDLWEERLEPAGAAGHWYFMQFYRMGRGEGLDRELDPAEASAAYMKIEADTAAALKGRSL